MSSRFSKVCFVILIVLSLIPYPVQATSGIPGTAEFGYGARIDLYGNDPQSAIFQAGNFNLDWIAIDFDWAQLQSTPEQPPNWSGLDLALKNAKAGDVSVLISITDAPDWAMDDDGPAPDQTVALAEELLSRYAGEFHALELFPMANTRNGWGTDPKPAAYAGLLHKVAQAIQHTDPSIVLVAGGLTPSQLSIDIDDLTFLKELYRTGVTSFAVLGLRLPPLGISPLTPRSHSDLLVLRHYEKIRKVMIDNGHKNGLIWITGFSWDDDEIHSSMSQAYWLKQAYLLFRAQLYIGAAFFDGLNVSAKDSNTQLLSENNYHPGFDELIQIIALDHQSQTIKINLEFHKKLIRKIDIKGS